MSIDQRSLAENTFNLISMSGGKDSLAQCLYAVENGVQHERACIRLPAKDRTIPAVKSRL